MRTKAKMAAATLTALVFGSAAMAQEQTLDTRIGKLTFTHDFVNGYPTDQTVQKLYDERDFQRAVQVYLWASPMVSNGEVRRVLMEAKGCASQKPYPGREPRFRAFPMTAIMDASSAAATIVLLHIHL